MQVAGHGKASPRETAIEVVVSSGGNPGRQAEPRCGLGGNGLKGYEGQPGNQGGGNHHP